MLMDILGLLHCFDVAKYGGKLAHILCIFHSELEQQNQKFSPPSKSPIFKTQRESEFP